MARPSKLAEAGPVVASAVEAGASLEDAAVSAGVSFTTLKRWLERGRSEPYGQLVGRVDRARELRRDGRLASADDLEPEELRRVVAEVARRGSVPAMRLLWEMICADRDQTEEKPADPVASIDELTERRQARAG